MISGLGQAPPLIHQDGGDELKAGLTERFKNRRSPFGQRNIGGCLNIEQVTRPDDVCTCRGWGRQCSLQGSDLPFPLGPVCSSFISHKRNKGSQAENKMKQLGLRPGRRLKQFDGIA